LGAGQDAYYLRLERLFRALYDAVASGEGSIAPYSMSVAEVRGRVRSWWRMLARPSVAAVHGVVLATVTAVAVAMVAADY
jgi:hypothetical protein